ncbi:MAG: DUF5654 family protein [Candidatus Aenigmatarchaeota archaeon]
MLTKILKKNNWRHHSRNWIIRQEALKIGKIFRDNLVTLLLSAFGFTAAFSWNSAIQEGIRVFFPEKGSFYYKLYVAIVVTLIAVIATYFLSRFKSKE